jgi:hypothetical protein
MSSQQARSARDADRCGSTQDAVASSELRPTLTTHHPQASHEEIAMHNLKWIAIPVAVLGLMFLFFGVLWQGAVQFGVAVGLLAIGATIWRTTSGAWPFINTSPG